MYIICYNYLVDSMRSIMFDEVIHSEFWDSIIDYGIMYGSNTVVYFL